MHGSAEPLFCQVLSSLIVTCIIYVLIYVSENHKDVRALFCFKAVCLLWLAEKFL